LHDAWTVPPRDLGRETVQRSERTTLMLLVRFWTQLARP
jgi:hypothetical protein